MAKLKLTNGDILHLRLKENSRGDVEILCADTAISLLNDAWPLAMIKSDGTIQPSTFLQGGVKARLKFDKWGAIKVSK